MGEWASYRLEDFLLFAPRTYYRLFELHNTAIWPLQLLLLATGLAIAGLAAASARDPRPVLRRAALPLALVLLALTWIGVGVGFHWRRYAEINWAAEWFGSAFLLQAVLMSIAAAAAALAPSPSPSPGPVMAATERIRIAVGAGLLGFALLLQPWLGLAAGRSWRAAEWFGAAPDPTVLATLGALLMLPAARASAWVRWLLRACWPVPIAWCAVSGATLAAMGAPLAPLLPLAALLALGTRFAASPRRR